MRKYVIKWLKTATGHDSKWTDIIYDNIAWGHLGEALCWLVIGQCTQLSKYMNNLLPTAKCLQAFDNKHDRCCFDCQQLWENTNHVLQCLSEAWFQARTDAFTVLWQHFQKQHTPNVMTNLLCDSMDHWFHHHCIVPPQWPLIEEPIMIKLTMAFISQKQIGWNQFFHSELSKDWLPAIATYYHKR